MALIITGFDLSGTLPKESDVVASPGNVNVGFNVTGASSEDQVIVMKWKVQAEGEDYHDLKDEDSRAICTKINGNESDNVNIFGVNATNLKLEITSQTDNPDGTLNVWAINN